MRKILVLDDSSQVCNTVKEFLKDYTVSTASNLSEATSALQMGDFSLLIVDVGLPDGSGFQFVSKLKAENKIIPTIFLTSHSELNDKLLAFSLGAEDYIVKPFEPLELKARVVSVLNRVYQGDNPNPLLVKGDLIFDLTAQRLQIKTQAEFIDLTPFEFRVLLYMAKHEEHVLSRENILDAVWTESISVTDRTVDTHISNIRKKMKKSRCKIIPVYGVGYRFVVEPMQ